LKIVFFGTPDFAAQVLQYLIEKKQSIAAIVTQPDRPQGRNLKLTPPAVKQTASLVAPTIPILQPKKASEPEFLQMLSELQADLFVVAAYGQILPQNLLDIPAMGCINIHASLLPKYRGAAPIQRALMNGDPETGVSIQKMVFRLDAGDVIAEGKIPLPIQETHGELQQRLCDLSKLLLLSVLKRYEAGIPPGEPQDESQVTLAPKILPEELQIQWSRSARSLHNLIRGLSPRPGAWCWIGTATGKKKLKILQTSLSEEIGNPGEILAFEKGRCLISAQNGSLELIQVQPEGKKAMSVRDWMLGCKEVSFFVEP
jgi:methionyl-tRNA formyltransferase